MLLSPYNHIFSPIAASLKGIIHVKFFAARQNRHLTGGAGGLGRPMCATFAAAGANVIVASRSRDKIEAEAAALREQGYRAAAIAVDVTDEQQVDNLIEQTVATFGAVDVMVNNAGRWGRSSAAEDTQLDEWRNVVEQNLTGVFLPCKVAGQQMIIHQAVK